MEMALTPKMTKSLPKQKIPDRPQRVLVAEDNPMNQKVIQRLLVNLGFSHVDIVENGRQCVDLMRNQISQNNNKSGYDLILMDVMVR